jgi:hypothetical protein
MTQQTPWAVLLCKFSDDHSEPPFDFKTICEEFFTQPGGPSGAGFNAVQFFSDMSHGQLDLTGSRVSDWVQLSIPSKPASAEADVMAAAKQAAAAAGFDVSQYFGVVLSMNVATGAAQGSSDWGPPPPGPGVVADWRRVDGRNFDGTLAPRGTGGGNGTEVFGQEMGHGYGLGHSRRNGSDEDYNDPWDIMSTARANSIVDQRWDARGPGLNAWNMRGRGWLDESRLFKPVGESFDETIQLRPLHRRDLKGWLAAELPPRDDSVRGRYLVEFRVNQDWDQGFPRPAVFVHRYEDEKQSNDGSPHSYVMPGTQQNYDLVQGDVFDPALPITSPRVDVLTIDGTNLTATVRLRCHPGWSRLIVGKGADGNEVIFGLGLDGTAHYISQPDPRGDWGSWSNLGGTQLQQLAVGSWADGRLELFALGGDGAAYTTWQNAPNGDFGPWSGLGGTALQQLAVGSWADGRLELFALGGDGAAYTTWQNAPNGDFGPWSGLGGD